MIEKKIENLVINCKKNKMKMCDNCSLLLNKIYIRIKSYDKKLYIKKGLDGTVEINRNSVYNKHNVFNIVKFENIYMGSGSHVVEILKKMDSTRHDFFTPSIINNNNLRKHRRSDDRMHSDIANFIRNGTQFIG